MSLSALLASHVRATSFADLPGDAVEAVKRSLIDTTGTSLAAAGLSPRARACAALARHSGEAGAASVLGFGFATSAAMAAFANGAMAHALDFEDTHDPTLVHPNAAVIPAALAVAESLGGIGGERLATALALGSDLVCRLGKGFVRDTAQGKWMFVPMLGLFGAAAAAGKLLDLTQRQLVDAFSLAMCQVALSAQEKHSPNSHVREIRDAFNARAGVVAAFLAKQDVHGFDAPLEGEAGLYALFADGDYDPAAILDGLGHRFDGVEVSYKPWPSCRGTHAFVEGAINIVGGEKLAHNEIASVQVAVNPLFSMLCIPEDQKRSPRNAIDAKFSIPFTVAVALRHGTVGLEHYDEAGLNDPEVLALAARVRHTLRPDWTFREATRGIVEVTATDGRVWSHEICDPRGHPDNPMSAAELDAKFLACAARAPVPASPATLRGFLGRVRRLEAMQDARDLWGSINRAMPEAAGDGMERRQKL